MILNIHPAIVALEKEMVSYRRHFHQYPELGYKEYDTGRYILSVLEDLNLPVQYPLAETGIAATMANGDGPVIALRADMDALPIQETTDIPYKSRNEGVMHACGHDGHMAILLGTLLALHRHRDLWRGTVKFLFQPAEEGGAGALRMLGEGALRDPAPASIFSLHLWNYQPIGTIGIQAGPVLAAADLFTITVQGKGGHAAAPQGAVDAVVVASQLVTVIQSIVSRNVNPLESAVVTLGSIHGGDNFNVIADKVVLEGTARAYEENVRQLVRDRLEDACRGMAGASGAVIDLDYRDGYPPTVNDDAMTTIAHQAARKVVAEGAREPYLSMGSEDMSYFLQEIPGCLFFVGSAREGDPAGSVPQHCSHYDIDERALTVGASVFMEIVMLQLPVVS
ncbi:M20 family metallopeptidase [Candidatus Neomarinimicrobiota bacterium]